MRVLFVDDDVRVLQALERVFFELETGWTTKFLGNAGLALAELNAQAYDVVVSDLRLAGIDGVALLTRVRDVYPRMARIVLSGHDDEAAALKMAKVAHQFLAKPCAAETLYQVIARTEQLMQLLGDRKLQSIVGQVSALPSASHLHHELIVLLGQDDASAAAVAEIVKQDPGMSSKLLQLAGSAFFNSSASVVDIETAILRLGLRTLRTLSLTDGVFAPAPDPAESSTISAAGLQRRSLEIAQLAASMARLPEDAASAYTAGLLCDVGQLLFVDCAPERLYVTEAEARQAGVPGHVAELSTWGVSHAELGAFLLGLWGLPFQIVEAVANHHTPQRQLADRVGLPQLVWLAACIVEAEEPAAELLHRFGAEELYATSRRRFEQLKMSDS